MEMRFNGYDALGEIVAGFPKAADTFKRYGIDFCCGGNRSLDEAVKEMNLSIDLIVSELHKEYENASKNAGKDIDWREAPIGELIDHIVATHHAYLNKELPEIGRLINKILRVHGAAHGDLLSKVHKLFNTLRVELEQHLIREEEVVFPLIKELETHPCGTLTDRIYSLVEELEGEHEGAGDILKELRRITHHFEAPADTCTTFILTYKRLEALESDIFQHVHLENNILFPRVEGILGLQ